MLLNSLYTIRQLQESENQLLAEVELHPEHAIFQGHFPGQPVMPGVCMLEMITEITGFHLKRSLRISEAPLIKFLLMIDPRKNPLISLEINYRSDAGTEHVHGKIFFEERVFMKFQMVLLVF